MGGGGGTEDDGKRNKASINVHDQSFETKKQ